MFGKCESKEQTKLLMFTLKYDRTAIKVEDESSILEFHQVIDLQIGSVDLVPIVV